MPLPKNGNPRNVFFWFWNVRLGEEKTGDYEEEHETTRHVIQSFIKIKVHTKQIEIQILCNWALRFFHDGLQWFIKFYRLPSRSFFKLPCTSVLHLTAFRSSTVAQASKPAWSQESFITKSYNLTSYSFDKPLKIYWLILFWLFGNLSNLMTFDCESSSLPRSCKCPPGRRGSRSRRGASACWRVATVWCNNFKPPWCLGWRTRSVEKLIQWEFLKYSFLRSLKMDSNQRSCYIDI